MRHLHPRRRVKTVGRVSAAGWLVWCSVSMPVAAQSYYDQYGFSGGDAGPDTQYQQQYRFVPREGVGAGNTWSERSPQDLYPESDIGGYQPPYSAPDGRVYRFREEPGLSQPSLPQHRFRPDPQLGQMPKNWGTDREWAEDPTLRQGMIFRPLDGKRKDSRRQAPPEVLPESNNWTPGFPPPGYGYFPGYGLAPDDYPVPGVVPWGM